MAKTNRLAKLKKLEKQLRNLLDRCEDDKAVAGIARQYRETLRDIDEIEGSQDNDEVAGILQKRADNGAAGAVR
jgi:hypothetical protein